MRRIFELVFGILTSLYMLACPEPIQYAQDSIQPPDPKHMVYIPDAQHRQSGFWIDAFEFPNIPNQRPRGNTSFAEAQKACAESGKRLCTAAEWRRACQGSNGYRFGYGDSYEANRCHTAVSLQSGHTSLLQTEEFLSESGQKQHCQTDGVFDLIGNLEEWVLDDWQGRPASLEGGAWYTFTSYADCSGNYSRQPDYRTPLDRPVNSAGFRCCWTPESPTLLDIAADSDHRSSSVSTVAYNAQAERTLSNGVKMDLFEYPNQYNALPLTGVSWNEAQDRCSKAGKRLCSVEEWELGCSGEAGWPYPFGETYIPSLCALEQTSLVPSGTFFGCQSPFGLQDMVGSVWEWTSTPFDATVLRQNPVEQLIEIRGGSWFVDPQKGVCKPRDGYPLAHSSDTHPDLGFRCCRGEPFALSTKNDATAECPSDMIAVNNFCIDQYEYPNLPNVQPFADATFTLAKEACTSHGKHLCTDLEWLEACEGHLKPARRWPYGSTYVAHACNDHGWVVEEEKGSAVGSGVFDGCKTPENIFDLSGNLWEWTDNQTGRLRGGSWQLSAGLGQCRSYTDPQSNYHSGETGFRCCTTQIEAQRLRLKR